MAPDSRVDIETIDIIPDILDKSDETIVRRYVDAHDAELEAFENDLIVVLSSKQLENASADELDRIGKLFGELGRRRGRNDVEYRNYLGSIVQSFGGRGTNPGIKFAIAGGINVDIGDIVIDENFDDLSDTLVLYDWTPHKTETLVEIFQLAKPSTVELSAIKYKVDGGSLGSTDNFVDTFQRDMALWEGNRDTRETSWDFFQWEELIEEVATVDVDIVGSDDSGGFSVGQALQKDTVQSTDSSSTKINDALTSDNASTDDAATRTAQSVAWEPEGGQTGTVEAVADWNGFNWQVQFN